MYTMDVEKGNQSL